MLCFRFCVLPCNRWMIDPSLPFSNHPFCRWARNPMSSFFLSLSLSFPFFLGFSSYPVFPLGIFFVMCSVLKRADRNSFYSPPISTLYFFFSSLITLKLNCYNPLFFYLIGQSLERNAEDISILMGRGVEMSRSESVQDSINTLQNYIDQYGQYR